jgi:hypothetical protein
LSKLLGAVQFDTAFFYVQTYNRQGKSFNVGLMIDPEPELKPSFTPEPWVIKPWYIHLSPQRKTQITEKDKFNLFHATGDTSRTIRHILLEEVKIISPVVIPNSFNLNGSGKADLVYTKEDFEEKKYATLLDFFSTKIKGLYVGTNKDGGAEYKINGRTAQILIDGWPIDPFVTVSNSNLYGGMAYLDNINQLLRMIFLEDVNGIEISYNSKYTNRYQNKFHIRNSIQVPLYAYIEITTRSGGGPAAASVPSSANFNYLIPKPFQFNKQFYKPQYPTQDSTSHWDRRATIHWEPFILTTEVGEPAQIEFFSADKPTTYTVRVEGIDEQGNLLVETIKIPIKQRE